MHEATEEPGVKREDRNGKILRKEKVDFKQYKEPGFKLTNNQDSFLHWIIMKFGLVTYLILVK